MAPANPFPAALDDCVSAYEFAAAEAPKFGGDSNRMFIVGGSAGGHLTLTTALRLVESASNSRLKGIFPLCPAVVMPDALSYLSKELMVYENPLETYADAAMIDKPVRATCAGL